MSVLSRSITFGFLLAVLGCNPLPSQTEILDLASSVPVIPELKVAVERCDLMVPLTEKQTVWTWGVSGENACEYSIQMTINNGSDTYQLGYSKFNGNRNLQRGTLHDLIASGQTDVWHVTQNSGNNIGTMNGRMNGHKLELSLTDPSLIERIFTSRPETATLETGGTMLLPHRITVPIEYVR